MDNENFSIDEESYVKNWNLKILQCLERMKATLLLC